MVCNMTTLSSTYDELDPKNQEFIDALAIEAGFQSFEDFFLASKVNGEFEELENAGDVTAFDAVDALMQSFDLE